MKKLNIIYILMISVGFACGSGSEKDWGSMMTDTRDISGINQIKLEGAINLYLSQGDLESMEIKGFEKAMEYLKISENGSELIIDFDPDGSEFFKNKTPEIHLTIADLQRLVFDGVGNIETKNTFEVGQLMIRGDGVGNVEMEIQAESLDAQFNMMGNVDLSGSATYAKISFEGMGNLEASDLITQTMDLQSRGMGNVEVHCEGELSIYAQGMGSVTYTGNPTVIKEEIKGLGNVSRN
ncbi:Putative auto-transporter adhesin, head GIN domain [Algoriphagus ornithinivorans]|uniref:Putative auto-transporter adhesin, head GIN domain n=1 Tax=Algoriphagus ornithinivorans TaxID=226506 RepID=A0A1I5GUE7_9BACT|nr:head GIN domain-containing protein [Algoriphagus ornithinivorans]SFO39628.1 Putative auto-transporter adhesin, head GIN domain [Algoriphagus ornithinivorans]